MRGSVVVVGESERIRRAVKRADELAKGDVSALIVGPEGSGRQHLARYIHFRSSRSGGPLKTVDCLTFDANNVQRRLYGLAAGVSDGVVETNPGLLELAAGGTLVLTDLHRAPTELAQQLESIFKNGRFSRVGDEQDVHLVDCALVGTAESRDLVLEQLRDWFPPGNTIELPPLNERPEDIPLLLQHFIKELNDEFGKSLGTPDVVLIEKLCKIRWRRNVLDLKKLARDAVENSSSDAFQRSLIPGEILAQLPAPSDPTQLLRDCMKEITVEALHAGLPIPLMELTCSDQNPLKSVSLRALLDGCGTGAALSINSTVRDAARDLSERKLRQLLGLESRRSFVVDAVLKRVIEELGISREFASVGEVYAAYERVKELVEKDGFSPTRDRMREYLERHIGKRVSAGRVSEVRKELGADLRRSRRPKQIGIERGLAEAANSERVNQTQDAEDFDEADARSVRLQKMGEDALNRNARRFGIADDLPREKKIASVLRAEVIRDALSGQQRATLDIWAEERKIASGLSKDKLLDELVRRFLAEQEQQNST